MRRRLTDSVRPPQVIGRTFDAPSRRRMRLDIGRIQASDLDAIRRLHVHFLGEVSDARLAIEDVVVNPEHRRKIGS